MSLFLKGIILAFNLLKEIDAITIIDTIICDIRIP